MAERATALAVAPSVNVVCTAPVVVERAVKSVPAVTYSSAPSALTTASVGDVPAAYVPITVIVVVSTAENVLLPLLTM